VNFRAILFIVLSSMILMVSVLMRPAPKVGVPPADDQAQIERVVDAPEGGVSGDGIAAMDDATTTKAEVEDASPAPSEQEVAEESPEPDKPEQVATEDSEVTSDASISALGVSPVLEADQILDLIESRRPANTPQENALQNSPHRT